MFSFRRRRRRRRPFLFDRYHVLEGVCLQSYQMMTKKKNERKKDVPFYTHVKDEDARVYNICIYVLDFVYNCSEIQVCNTS